MCGSRWPITLLVLCLFGSATSSPVSIYTPAPPLPLQILPPAPSPTVLPSIPSPSLGTPSPTPPPFSNSAESGCSLTISPSTLVVRFGDPVTANCSVQGMKFTLLGWTFSPVFSDVAPEPTMDHFSVWTVDRMTYWNMKPMCFALLESAGQCHINFPLTVYKPPDNVSISIDNHTGPMLEGHQYTLQCIVENVAPVENLIVTFYSGKTVLGQLQSKDNTTKEPVTEIFTLNINTSKEDNGAQYWCEAELELGPEGPQPPPVVLSQTITATVHFGPQLICPTKLEVRKGERLSCEVRGNPQPLVIWFKDGQVVALPTRSSREDAGNYTVIAKGLLEQKTFTVEVEVIDGSGTTNSCNRHFLLAALLIQIISWL